MQIFSFTFYIWRRYLKRWELVIFSPFDVLVVVSLMIYSYNVYLNKDSWSEVTVN